jgi:hypothetical protein
MVRLYALAERYFSSGGGEDTRSALTPAQVSKKSGMVEARRLRNKQQSRRRVQKTDGFALSPQPMPGLDGHRRGAKPTAGGQCARRVEPRPHQVRQRKPSACSMTDNAAYWHPVARRLAKLGPRCSPEERRGVAQSYR